MKAAELFVEAISAPTLAQEGARRMALRSDLDPDEFKLLGSILQPWWDTERDTRALCRYLGARGAAAGHGSPAHRLAVRAAVLCARTALHLVRELDRAETGEILDALDAWARGKAPDTDLARLRSRARDIWSAAANADAYAAYASIADAAAYAAAADAADAATAAADASIAAADVYAAAADAYAAALVNPDWTKALNQHLSVMADMIRSEIPMCPVGLP